MSRLSPWPFGGTCVFGDSPVREGLEPLGHHALVARSAGRPWQRDFAGWQMGHRGHAVAP